MTVPLLLLAAGSVVAGWLGIVPFLHSDWLGHFLAPVVADVGVEHGHAEHGAGLEAFLVGASVLAGLLGILLAWLLYGRGRGVSADDALAARLPAVQRTLANKYYVDELYDAVVVRPLAWIARMCWKVIDTILINGSIHVGAFVTELTGDLGRFSTTGNVRNYALYFFAGVLLLFCWIVFQ
jgi:NADH-quinone oxidoreductase subunit L